MAAPASGSAQFRRAVIRIEATAAQRLHAQNVPVRQRRSFTPQRRSASALTPSVLTYTPHRVP